MQLDEAQNVEIGFLPQMYMSQKQLLKNVTITEKQTRTNCLIFRQLII